MIKTYKKFLNEIAIQDEFEQEFIQDELTQDEIQDEIIAQDELENDPIPDQPEELEDLIELKYNKSIEDWEINGELDLPYDFDKFYNWFINEIGEEEYTTASMKEEENEVVFHIPEDLYIEYLENENNSEFTQDEIEILDEPTFEGLLNTDENLLGMKIEYGRFSKTFGDYYGIEPYRDDENILIVENDGKFYSFYSTGSDERYSGSKSPGYVMDIHESVEELKNIPFEPIEDTPYNDSYVLDKLSEHFDGDIKVYIMIV